MPWTHHITVLWHGTTVSSAKSIIKSGPSLGRLRIGLDFGQAFYTTTSERQAKDWANQQVLKAMRTSPTVAPAIVSFSFDTINLSSLRSISFIRSDKSAYDYWDFVSFFKSGSYHYHRQTAPHLFDVVAGPLAVRPGIKKAIPNSDQMSFHTAAALKLLSSAKIQMTVAPTGHKLFP